MGFVYQMRPVRFYIRSIIDMVVKRQAVLMMITPHVAASYIEAQITYSPLLFLSQLSSDFPGTCISCDQGIPSLSVTLLSCLHLPHTPTQSLKCNTKSEM